jgi:hypothetical protein
LVDGGPASMVVAGLEGIGRFSLAKGQADLGFDVEDASR